MFVLRVKHVDANLLNHQYYVSLWYTGSDKPPGTEKKNLLPKLEYMQVHKH